MTQQIIGREREIKVLQRLLDSPRPEFLAIYGRRRVGKTYLIHEYYKDLDVTHKVEVTAEIPSSV